MKTPLCGLLMAFVVGYSYAQKPPSKFGEVTVEDLKLTQYEKDTSASAVVLLDYGESSLRFSQSEWFQLYFERLTRIKILTKEGLDWATFQIPLYHNSSNSTGEKVSGLKAVTYNLENGKMTETKIKNDAIFKEKVTDNWDVMKVTLPAVREGSVVEITYKVISDYYVNLQDWEFQYTIPVVWSEYRATIPEYYHYDKYMQGYVSLAVNEAKEEPAFITLTSKERVGDVRASHTEFSNQRVDLKETKYRWAAKDVPAFKEEPFITTSKDYISKINFELAYTKFPNTPIEYYMSSWADINKKFSEDADFGSEVTGNNFLKKTVEELTAGMTTPEQKIGALDRYVKSNVSWDGFSRRYTTKPLRKVLDEKKGNSAEINLLLASMLDKAGFKVSPVLVSTRDNGFVRQNIAISSQFNYVVCLVSFEDKQVLLDATDKLLPAGVLPERCLNGSGFVTSKDGNYGWVEMKSPVKSRVFYSTEFVLDEHGGLTGKVEAERSGYFAQQERKRYLTSGESDYVKHFVDGRSWTVDKSTFANTEEISEPFKEAHEITIDDHVTSTGNILYINPFVVSQMEENPFKLEKRSYPVDFGSPLEQLLICKLTIPPGYVVDELPKSQLLKLPENGMRYIYNIVHTGNVITLTSNLQINKSLFSQEEYPDLREFYNVVVAKQAEQIVLKKQ